MVQLVQEQRLAHSQKPERFRELIMELTGNRKRIELFARCAANDDWDVWGNQAAS
jgi:N6-adenosine-specific RNA methylase IME4